MKPTPAPLALASLLSGINACESCEHPEHDIILTRNLEGRLKQKNYGADWGDFVSFVRVMRRKAEAYDVDLLVVDTGGLHDGAGLSDATSPSGLSSNPIFEWLPLSSENAAELIGRTEHQIRRVNETRAEVPRIIVLNTGSIRFDLVNGPFAYDDCFIVSPLTNGFQYIPDVAYTMASQVLPTLDAGPYEKRSTPSLSRRDFSFSNHSLPEEDDCFDPSASHPHCGLRKRSAKQGRVIRRQSTSRTLGYITSDDFGTHVDDTVHSAIPITALRTTFKRTALSRRMARFRLLLI
ncbi:hypothetical protein LTR08_005068 [Meristemomyces frigidus]|nr:hypothetical protein LTR08_005068 [Meristemomyces frigidus]